MNGKVTPVNSNITASVPVMEEFSRTKSSAPWFFKVYFFDTSSVIHLSPKSTPAIPSSSAMLIIFFPYITFTKAVFVISVVGSGKFGKSISLLVPTNTKTSKILSLLNSPSNAAPPLNLVLKVNFPSPIPV